MINFILGMSSLILLFLEVTYPRIFLVFGVKPDLTLILIIFLSLYSKGRRIFFWAALLGGLKDFLSADLFGINIFSYCLLAIIMSMLEARFFLREKISSLFIFVFCIVFLNASLVHIIHIFFSSLAIPPFSILKILILEPLISAAWSIPVIYLLKKCASKFFMSQSSSLSWS